RRLLESGDDEVVGLRECRKRAGLRRDIAELDRARLRDRRHFESHRENGTRCGRVFQERAAVDGMTMSRAELAAGHLRVLPSGCTGFSSWSIDTRAGVRYSNIRSYVDQ